MPYGIVIGAVVGGLLGYGSYRLIGCPSGGCPITSSPWLSTIYGIVLGGMLFGNLL